MRPPVAEGGGLFAAALGSRPSLMPQGWALPLTNDRLTLARASRPPPRGSAARRQPDLHGPGLAIVPGVIGDRRDGHRVERATGW